MKHRATRQGEACQGATYLCAERLALRIWPPTPEGPMNRLLLNIAGEDFTLAPDTDDAQVMTNIETAVRTGGAFVDIALADSTHTAVLISPGLPVTLTRAVSDVVGLVPARHLELDIGAYDDSDFSATHCPCPPPPKAAA